MAPSDQTLLQQFVRARSSEAFDQLVQRHAGMVHGSILRKVRDRALADDATQAVFLVLIQKAPTLAGRAGLGGWLLKTAHFAAADALRRQSRHARHERRASQRRPEAAAPATALAGQEQLAALDDALASLAPIDRDALLLRFYQNESFADIAIALATTEDGARKRTGRALAKLRGILQRRGTTLTVSALAVLMAASSKSALAAGAGLAFASSTSALHSLGATSRGVSISKGVLHMFTSAKLKLLAAVTASGATVAATGVVIYAAALAAAPAAPKSAEAAGATASPTADWRTDLPTGLKTILAGWEENAGRIKSIQGKGMMLVEDSRFLEFPDRDGTRYNSQLSTFSFYKQGDQLKFEVIHDHEFDTGKKRVTYHIPFGEYGFLESGDEKKDNAKAEAIRVAHGVGGGTERTLVTGGHSYVYDVEEHMAYINEPPEASIFHDQESWAVTGAYVDDLTLAERIGSINKRIHSPPAGNFTFAVTGPLEGIYTMTESLTWSPKGVRRTGKNIIRVDSAKGWSVVSNEGSTNGQPDCVTACEYAKVNDCWVLVHVDEKQFDPDHRPVPPIHIVYTIDQSTLHVNAPIAGKTFDIDSFLAPATWVSNEKTHREFYYKDVPTAVKLRDVEELRSSPSTPVVQSLATE